MTYEFTLPEFPDAHFKIETSPWTGKSVLWKDDERIQQSTEKGKPFLIPASDGGFWKAYPKPSLPDLVPTLEINGTKRQIAPRLSWYEYVLGGLPFLLVITGGALGGVIGALAMLVNYQIFRSNSNTAIKYAKVLGIIIAAVVVFSLVAYLITQATSSV